MRRIPTLALAALLLAPSLALAGDVPLLIYRDANESSRSDLAQSVTGDDAPLPGVAVTLLGGDDALSGETGEDGAVVFEGVADGSWLLAPELPEGATPTTHNVAVRLPQVVAAGGEELVYLALGDSTPVVGSKTPYPKRLAALLEGLTPVKVVNLADPGTKTADWLPDVGGDWANPTVQGWLPQADVITLTIGGNDLQDAAFQGDVELALSLVDEALENIATIAAGIRAENPQADLVVTVYPNYALSSEWEQYIPPSYIGIVRMALDSKIQEMRQKLGAIDGVIVADCYAAFQVGPMDDFMYDPIHVNDAGHQLYAETIFHALGGVTLPADDGAQRMIGLAMEAPVVGEDIGGDGADAGGHVVPDAGVEQDGGAGPGDTAGAGEGGPDGAVGEDGAASGGGGAVAVDGAGGEGGAGVGAPDAVGGDTAIGSVGAGDVLSGSGGQADGGCASVPTSARDSAWLFAAMGLFVLTLRRSAPPPRRRS